MSFPSPEDLPNPGIELTTALAGEFFTAEPPAEPLVLLNSLKKLQKENYAS